MKKGVYQNGKSKKILLILGAVFSIVIFLVIAFCVFDNSGLWYVADKENDTVNITAEDIQAEQPQNETPATSTELDILPYTYDLSVSILGDFSSHDLTTYLRYSNILKESKLTSITDGYQYLLDSHAEILIPQIYIDQYVLDKIAYFSSTLSKINKGKEAILPYLSMNKDSSIDQELKTCIQDNLDSFFEGKTCTEYLEKINDTNSQPTLSSLVEAVKYSNYESVDDYQRYLNNQQYIYQITKERSELGEQFKEQESSYGIYLDLNKEHLYKLKLLTNYIGIVNRQVKTNKDITDGIQELSSLISGLMIYKEGVLGELDKLPFYKGLNLSKEDIPYAKLNPQVSLLAKTITKGEQVTTYYAPMYTFSPKDNTSSESLAFNINDNNFNEDYDVPPTTQSKGTVRVPIFMYHQIGPVPDGQSRFRSGLYVAPNDFEVEMAYLVKKNYKSVTTEEYYNLLKTGKNPTQKTVMITFDDGIENQYLNAYPILKKYNLKGVFFVVAHKSSITLSQRKEMAQNGMSIDSHSSTHLDLTKVSDPTKLSYEIASSKSSLQATTGKQVYAFAYPGCGWNKETLSYVSGAGYLLGMSCGNTIDNRPSNKLVLSRVHAFGDLKSFIKLLSGVH